MSGQQVGIWEEAVNYLKTLSQHSCGETEANHERHYSGQPITGLRFVFCFPKALRQAQGSSFATMNQTQNLVYSNTRRKIETGYTCAILVLM